MSLGSVSFSEHSYHAGNFSQHGAPRSAQTDDTLENTHQKASNGSTKNDELSKDEQKQVTELKQRDREVRAHEAAHVGAGSGVVSGGVKFSYQSGPDGKRYAVGGEVGIDASPVKDNPEATIRKMQQVRAAALAPASPSGQDRSVAAAAAAQEATARMELNAAQQEKSSSDQSAQSVNKPTGKKVYTENAVEKQQQSAAATVDFTA
jgi:hypothetical protein